MLSSGNRGVISSTCGVLDWVPRLASIGPDRFFVYPVANIQKMMDFSMLMDSGSIMYALNPANTFTWLSKGNIAKHGDKHI